MGSGKEIWQQQETQRINLETQREREWWPLSSRFFTLAQAKEAQKQGILVDVPHVGDNYRLISLLNDHPNGEPHLLRPEALSLMLYALSLWRARLGEEHKGVKVAITSLYRDSVLQSKLQQEGYSALGSEDSSHLAGAAFDFSARSYYIETGAQLQKVQKWNPHSGIFRPEPSAILQEVLKGLASEGLCNFLIENCQELGKVEPTVFHVCVKPTVEIH